MSKKRRLHEMLASRQKARVASKPMSWLKKSLLGVGGLVGVAALGLGGFVLLKISAYNSSLDQVYDVPLPKIERVTDPLLLARGEHVAHTIMPCLDSGCHGKDLGGG